MALTTTRLAAAITASQLTIPVADATIGFPSLGVFVNQPMMVDGELMYVKQTLVSAAPGLVQVSRRGSDGGVAEAHDILAQVVTSSLASDFPVVPAGETVNRPPRYDDVQTIGQDQTITIPTRNTTYYIQKGSAAAITLQSGSSAQIGITMSFISETAFAHTLTYAPGFFGTTTSSDVVTMTATVGSTIDIEVGAGGLLVTFGGQNVGIA